MKSGNWKSGIICLICAAALLYGAPLAFAQGTVRLVQTPFADNFSDRQVIQYPFYLNPFLLEGSLSNVTLEAGEPVLDGISSGQTVWATWYQQFDGIVTLSVKDANFPVLLTVYTDTNVPSTAPNPPGSFPGTVAAPPANLTSLTLVASNNYEVCYDDGVCGCHWRMRDQVSFHVKQGVAYQICVDSAIITDASLEILPVTIGVPTAHTRSPIFTTNTVAGGNFYLTLQFDQAPLNDNFGGRYQLSGNRIQADASNLGASKEPGEPDHQGNPGGSSVWYTWTAPASGRVTLTTNLVPVYQIPYWGDGEGLGIIIIRPPPFPPFPPSCGNEVDQNPPPVFYPIFAAYTGNAVDALTPAENLPMQRDDYPNGVEFNVVKGQTYQIAYDGNMGTTGVVPLFLALTPPATNDNFSARISLHGIHVWASGYNAGATHENGEPLFGGSRGKTVWWTWTAPVSGNVTLNLTYGDYNFPVAVFTGQKVSALQLVAEGSGGLSFSAVQGQAYQIAVSDDQGLTGAFDLYLQAPEVALPLLYTMRQRGGTVLSYSAAPGDIVELQTSTDNLNWYPSQTIECLGYLASFKVETHSLPHPNYRAILVDQVPLPPERRPGRLLPPVPLVPQPVIGGPPPVIIIPPPPPLSPR